MRALMFQCLSQGDNSNCTLIRLIKDNHHNAFFQEAYADEPRHRIVTGVCCHERRQLKNLPRICEVESMLTNVVWLLVSSHSNLTIKV